MPPSFKFSLKLNGNERHVTSIGRQKGSRQVFELLWSKLLPWAPGRTLLDVGCGEHEWTITDYQVSRCDIAPTGPRGYTRVEPDKPLPYDTDQFDVSMAAEVIEHTENPWLFVRELCRVARRMVIISTPNPQCAVSKKLFEQYGHFADFTARHNQEIGHWTPVFSWQLDEMARRAGWRVLRTEFVGGPFGDLRVPPGTLNGSIVPLLSGNRTMRTRAAVLSPS